MEDILFISPDFLRKCTNISSNMQDKFIQSAIREASDIDLKEVLGCKLYIKLKDLISNDEILLPENGKYKDLLDIAKYFLAYQAVSRIIVISSVKIDNIGANLTSDTNALSLRLADVFSMEDYYEHKANVYKKRLQDFICKGNYPEISCNSNLTSASSCNLFLGGSRGKYYKTVRR